MDNAAWGGFREQAQIDPAAARLRVVERALHRAEEDLRKHKIRADRAERLLREVLEDYERPAAADVQYLADMAKRIGAFLKNDAS
jgi:hypothetical protein